MRILSVNVGQPRMVEWRGRPVQTAIWKTPVAGPVPVAHHNLGGDQQADLTVHGGPDKAVYAYDATHYAAWQALLPAWTDWTPGLFGENLTTDGLLEDQVRIGDVFQVGTAVLRAVQPRVPCYKLNARFNDPGMTARFARAGRSGIYFRVEEPGTVQAGDALQLLEAADTHITIQTVAQALLTRHTSPELALALAELPYLPGGLRRLFTSAA